MHKLAAKGEGKQGENTTLNATKPIPILEFNWAWFMDDAMYL